MKRPPEPLDPSKFTVVPHVAVIDEFKMTNKDGSFVATIDENFLDKLIAHMNEREASTGDLAVGIIGHTPDEWVPEVEQPPVTAYARNWHKGDLFETGRKAAFVDFWIFNEDVEQVRKHPRRSAEVYADRYEIDQIAFLGATTPARDLGLMKLSRAGSGSMTVNCPGEMKMPDPTNGKPEPKESETGASKGIEGKLDQLLSMFTQFMQAAGAPKDAAPGAAGPGAGGDDISDEELEKLLAGAGIDDKGGEPKPDESRAGEKPTKNSAGYPGGDDTYVPDTVKKLQAETEGLRVKLARREVKDRLTQARVNEHRDVNPDDEELITDLVALPEDMRNRHLATICKHARELPTKESRGLNAALDAAVDGNGPARMTDADRDTVIKLARDKKISFEAAAAEKGFKLR